MFSAVSDRDIRDGFWRDDGCAAGSVPEWRLQPGDAS